MSEMSLRRRGGRRSSCASISACTTSALAFRHPTGVNAAQPRRAAAATGRSRSCGGSPTSLSNVDSHSVREMTRPVGSAAPIAVGRRPVGAEPLDLRGVLPRAPGEECDEHRREGEKAENPEHGAT